MTLFKKYYTCNTVTHDGKHNGALIVWVGFWKPANFTFNIMVDYVDRKHETIIDFRRVE